MKEDKVLENIENDKDASVRAKGIAKARRRDLKSKKSNVIKETYYQKQGKYICKVDIKGSGAKYSSHYCKYSKSEIERLKNEGHKVIE